MSVLATLKNSKGRKRSHKRLGRGTGSGKGKTCARGVKGAGARSGYKRRHGTEGGQLPLFKKLPTRGFSNARFATRLDAINLRQISDMFADGEVVNEATLRAHGFISGKCHGVKILSDGELTKKVTFEIDAISAGAKKKLDDMGIEYTIKSS
jgi:large subunit ribosomal protein L15